MCFEYKNYYPVTKNLIKNYDSKQRYISKISNIYQTNNSKYKLAKINIPVSSLIVLANFYSTSIDYLLVLTDKLLPILELKMFLNIYKFSSLFCIHK